MTVIVCLGEKESLLGSVAEVRDKDSHSCEKGPTVNDKSGHEK